MPLLVALLVALVVDLGVSSCVSLPAQGPVRARTVEENGGGETLVDYTPAGPRADSGPLPLVDSFLTAMTATPLNTYVAREFLTEQSGKTWVPEQGTVAYGSQELVARPHGGVMVRLRDVVELDSQGTWRGDPTSGRGHDYDLHLVRQGGRWRISHPPNRLIIPRAHFDTQYAQYLLYFVDRSAQVMVPEPVYVPRGQQTSTLLLSALLKGPEPANASVERTFFPRGTSLDGISVPVSRGGTAEVPLSDQVLDASNGQLKGLSAQIAWTLGQVPGVQRLSVTVGGTPIDLPGPRSSVGVGDFSEFDPSLAYASTALFGVRDRRVVTLGSQESRVSGPYGALPLAPRSIAVDPLGQRIAGVSSDGTKVLVSDRDGVPGRAARLSDTVTVHPGGTDLLRPAYDLYGQLWLMDRTRSGARLSVVRGATARALRVPGLSDRQVSGFVLSRDGTRLVAEERRGGHDGLWVARVSRDAKGRVLSVGHARRLVVEGAPDRILDIAWRTPATLAVLVAPSAGTTQVLLAKVDGSSTSSQLSSESALFRGRAVRLVTSPSRGTPLLVSTASGRLFTLSGSGHWTVSSIRPGLQAPTFVG
ncbi:MAG: LpqB family beta-propeller domain-containing protein [Nocardioidaceae bacterium]